MLKTISLEQFFKVTLNETQVRPIGIRVAEHPFYAHEGQALFFEQIDSKGDYANYRDFLIGEMAPDVGKRNLDKLNLSNWNKYQFEGYRGRGWPDLNRDTCVNLELVGMVGSMHLPCMYSSNEKAALP